MLFSLLIWIPTGVPDYQTKMATSSFEKNAFHQNLGSTGAQLKPLVYNCKSTITTLSYLAISDHETKVLYLYFSC